MVNKGILVSTDEYRNIVGVHGFRIARGIAVVVMILAVIFNGIYRIDTGEGAIFTSVNGIKEPITKVGWGLKFPLFTDLQKKTIVNNNLYFPSDYIQLESEFKGDTQTGSIGIDIKTTDDKVVDTGVLMKYQIVDLYQYGVMNVRPEEQLQKDFDATVFNYLQTLDSGTIINDIGTVNVALLDRVHTSNIEEQFGVKVTEVSLLRPTYTQIALKAMSEKQAIQAVAEGKLNAAKSEALAIETIAEAMKKQSDILANIPANQLDFNAKMTLYGNLKGQPNVIWVIPNNQDVTIVAKS